MIRATVWTVGLFGAGAAVTRVFPGTWTEPLVLLALGIALLFVSARTVRTAAPASRGAAGLPRAAPSVEPAPVRAATPIPAPAAAHVENTA
jgi:hypothetical protein